MNEHKIKKNRILAMCCILAVVLIIAGTIFCFMNYQTHENHKAGEVYIIGDEIVFFEGYKESGEALSN